VISKTRKHGHSIGFVPTMGSLHEGHLSLLRKSVIENNTTICSIYVNPTQFNDQVDFQKYPRNISRDEELLRNVNCSVLFVPCDNEIYTENQQENTYNFSPCMHILEGEKRPGHFSGVITIVHKLFNIIQPDRAYFGEKDYQQLWLIKLFVKTLQIPVKIKSCPTIRDQHGLALSSRNERLTIKQKKLSLNLFKTLSNLKNEIQIKKKTCQNGQLNNLELNNLKNKAIREIQNNPLIKLDYFEVIDVENFSFALLIDINKKYRILVAAYVGNTRLIDNILID
tara:strand:- start:2940 stop:3785 length:846 start_codon:yes stop_codon:yes gene_type:complete